MQNQSVQISSPVSTQLMAREMHSSNNEKLGFKAGDKTNLQNHYTLYSALDLDQ